MTTNISNLMNAVSISKEQIEKSTQFHAYRTEYLEREREYKNTRFESLCKALDYLAKTGEKMSAKEISAALSDTVSPNEVASLFSKWKSGYVWDGSGTMKIISEKVRVPRYFIECDKSGNVIPGGKSICQCHFHQVYGAERVN